MYKRFPIISRTCPISFHYFREKNLRLLPFEVKTKYPHRRRLVSFLVAAREVSNWDPGMKDHHKSHG